MAAPGRAPRRRPPLRKPAITVREWMERSSQRRATMGNSSTAQPAGGLVGDAALPHEERRHQPSQDDKLPDPSISPSLTASTEQQPPEQRVYVGMGPRRRKPVEAPVFVDKATTGTSATGLPLPDPRGFVPMSLLQRLRRQRAGFKSPPPPPRKRRILAPDTPPPPDVDVASGTAAPPDAAGTAASNPPLGPDYSDLFAWRDELCRQQRDEESVKRVPCGVSAQNFYSAESRRAARSHCRRCALLLFAYPWGCCFVIGCLM